MRAVAQDGVPKMADSPTYFTLLVMQ